MRPLLLAGLLIAAAGPPAGLATASASDTPRGAIVATPRYVPAAGPVLAGDGAIVWLARRDDAVLDLWQAAPGGAPRRIQRFVGSDTEWLATPRLAASAAAVGLAFAETRARTERVLRTRSYLGGLGRPLGLVSSCVGPAPAQRSFDVTDTAAVFRDGPACAQAIVRAVGAATGTARQLPGASFAMRLAGGYEAWLEGPAAGSGAPGAAVVHESATGREITRAAAAELPRDVTDVALRADGTLALSYRSPAGLRVALLGPGATQARTLPLRLLAAHGARWLGDTLAVVAARRGDPRRGLLQRVDSAGAPVAALLAMGSDRDLHEHTDASASRLVWVERGCMQAVIRTTALPTPAVARQRGTPSCALRLRRQPRVRAGRLRLGVSCAGFARDCSARLTVRAGSQLVARGTARPNHGAPPYAAANLRLTRAARVLLDRHARIRVLISARIATTLRRTTRTLARDNP